MIILTLKITVTQNRHEGVIKTLRSMIGPTIADPDCSDCGIYRGIDNENEFYITQEWRRENDLEKYIRSNLFKIFLELMELSCESPTFRIRTVSKSKGIDYVESIRGIPEIY